MFNVSGYIEQMLFQLYKIDCMIIKIRKINYIQKFQWQMKNIM